jgi:tyrosine-protein kinase Etk/Wzc
VKEQQNSPEFANPSQDPSWQLERDQPVSFREVMDIVWSGKWIIAGITLVFFLFSVAYALSEAPVYSANGLIQIETEKNSLASSLGDMASMGDGLQQEVPAEMAILMSRMVLSVVAQNLKAYIEIEPNFFPVIGAVVARRNAGLGQPAAAPFNLTKYAWGGERIQVTAFDVPVDLYNHGYQIQAQGNGAFALLDDEDHVLLQGKVGERATADTSQGPISIFIQELVARPDTLFWLSHAAPSNVLSGLAGSISVNEQPKFSGVLRIEATSESPQEAAQLVNQVSDAYLKQNVERRSAQAEQSLEFLRQQLPKLKANVDESQARLNSYQLKKGTVDVQQETSLILNRAVTLESSRLDLVQQREAAAQKYTAQHPIIQGLTDQINGLEREQATIKKQIEALPETQQEILSLMRDLEVNTQLYTTLLNSSQELQVTKAGTTGNVRIIDYALVPRFPFKPNKPVTVAFGVLLGMFIGVAVVFGLRTLIRGVDRPEEVERATGLPTYASIPYSKQQYSIMRKVTGGDASGNMILAARDSNDVAIESIRSLRTSLHFAMLEAANNIVMFTGPVASLGKSFVTINLGAVLALSGKRVLVMDVDLRRGQLHKYMGVKQAPGLSDYIVGGTTLQQMIHKTEIDGLHFIAGGIRPPNPSELLMSAPFTDLLQEMSKLYDYVLIDTPPVLPVTDAAIIGRLAGTTLLVLKSAEHPMRVIEETTKRLRQAGVQIRGTVFNQVGVRMGSYGYGSYGQYYGYSADSYKSKPN